MSIWMEGNTIASLLNKLQTDSILHHGDIDDFPKAYAERQKVLKQIEEIVEKHYDKKGKK